MFVKACKWYSPVMACCDVVLFKATQIKSEKPLLEGEKDWHISISWIEGPTSQVNVKGCLCKCSCRIITALIKELFSRAFWHVCDLQLESWDSPLSVGVCVWVWVCARVCK